MNKKSLSLCVLSILLLLSAVVQGQSRVYDGYITYSIGDIAGAKTPACGMKTPNETVNNVNLTAVQGMAVGTKYAYVFKGGSSSSSSDNYYKYGMIYRVDLDTKERVTMKYYDPLSKDNTIADANKNNLRDYTQILYHGNEVEVVEEGDKVELFVSTATAGKTDAPAAPAIVRLQVEDDKMWVVDCYKLKNGGSAMSSSAMKHIKTVGDKMYFLVKNALNFYTVTLPTNPDDAPASMFTDDVEIAYDAVTNANPRSVPVKKLFDIQLKGAKYVQNINGKFQISDPFTESSTVASATTIFSNWDNQGFGYSPQQGVIFVPVTGKEGKRHISIILAYRVSDYTDEANVDDSWAGNKEVTTLHPEKTSVFIKNTTKVVTSTGDKFEVETASYRKGRTDQLYFNINHDQANGEGIYVIEMGKTTLAPPTTYKVRFDANGGKEDEDNPMTLVENVSVAETYSIPACKFIHDSYTGTGSEWVVEGVTAPETAFNTKYDCTKWYAHRQSDDKWLYVVPSLGNSTNWYKKGEQPSEAYLAIVTELSYPTTVQDDVITLYAFWRPTESDKDGTNNRFHIRYNGNGGVTDEGAVMYGETHHTYKTKSYTLENPFTRTGYTFVGWSAFRYHHSANTGSLDQWAFVYGTDPNDDGSGGTIESEEKWFPDANGATQKTNHILKSYGNKGTVTTTTRTNDDMIVFYANWARLKAGVLPTGTITKGSGFAFAGKIECTSDLWGARITITKKENARAAGGTVVKTKQLFATRTSVDPAYVDGFDISDIDIDISTLDEGEYTCTVSAIQVASNIREIELGTSEFTVKAPTFTVQIPTENGAVELANPNYTGSDGYAECLNATDNNIANYNFSTAADK